MKTLSSKKLIALYLTSLVWLSACSTSLSPGYVPSSSTDTDSGPADDGKMALGVKNYQQIFDSLVVMTGLTVSDSVNTNLFNYFTTNKATLPPDMDIQKFLPNKMNSTTNLAYEFCEVLTSNNATQTTFFAGTSFGVVFTNNATQSPAQLIVPLDKRAELVDHLLNRFLGPDDGSNFRADTRQSMMDLLGDLAQGAPANTGETRLLMRGACTVAATIAVSFI